MSTPLVSVVIPVFNADRWVKGAIGSMLAQSHRNIEIIAVDDGSSDRSLPMLEELRARDSRLRIIAFAQNQGIVAALNEGVRQAHGEFIARMDADDLATPRRIELQLDHMIRTGCDLCGSWVTEFGMGPARNLRLPTSAEDVHAHLLFQNVICHPTVLMRRNLMDLYAYRPGYEYAEDYDLFARMSGAHRLENIPIPLLRYRRGPDQMTVKRRSRMQEVCDRVRAELLALRGIPHTQLELRTHNRIRAAESFETIEELAAAENWLLKLCSAPDLAARASVVASQWARACIRAAPLGLATWTTYRRSELRRLYAPHALESLDILVLSALRLRHEGAAFRTLKRLGLSA